MAEKGTKKAPQKASKAKSVSLDSKTEKKAIRKKGRFLGWQTTPHTQAAFGGKTQGGRNNIKIKILASTGSVQTVEPRWFLVDASKTPVGRIATTIASVLMGKYRPTFSYGAGCGDGVIVINVDKAFFTSNKDEKKIYHKHTLYMGGLKSWTAGQMLKTKPEEVIRLAVQGMMPKNKLSRYQLSLLKLHRGASHPHASQKPVQIDFATPLKKLVTAA